MDLLLFTRQHVARSDVAYGTVKATIFVIADELLDDALCLLKRQRALLSNTLWVVVTCANISGRMSQWITLRDRLRAPQVLFLVARARGATWRPRHFSVQGVGDGRIGGFNDSMFKPLPTGSPATGSSLTTGLVFEDSALAGITPLLDLSPTTIGS